MNVGLKVDAGHYIKTHHVLRDQQHGFRHHRSCETQLITTIHDFAQCLNQGGQCDVVLLDFCKAFDKLKSHIHVCFISYTIMAFVVPFLPGLKTFSLTSYP